MIRRQRLRKISALALLVAMTAVSAVAQESLPTIDIGRRDGLARQARRRRHAAPLAGPGETAARGRRETQAQACGRGETPAEAHCRRGPRAAAIVRHAVEKRPRCGEAAASAGVASSIYVSGAEVQSHSYTRPGEALEIVPGLLVTQHSGEGKANQYQLRGFQLDHGTDLAITVDGMPLNMPTHGHGQGYADANFLMPELFGTILAHKGPSFADEGDFSAAGAVTST